MADPNAQAMQDVIENMKAAIAEQTTVDLSAAVLAKTLFDAFEANKNFPAQIQALVDAGRANNAGLLAAVVANTPADTAPQQPPQQ